MRIKELISGTEKAIVGKLLQDKSAYLLTKKPRNSSFWQVLKKLKNETSIIKLYIIKQIKTF